jgi:hypothetical protein
MATLLKAKNQTVKTYAHMDRFYLLENTVDLSGVATGDVVEALALPAKCLVLEVFTEVVTETGLVSTASVGDGVTPAGWGAATSVNFNAAVATRLKSAGTDAYAVANGKYYGVADTVDLTVSVTGGPITSGSVKVFAILVDLGF